jgi:hypothetical protein
MIIGRTCRQLAAVVESCGHGQTTVCIRRGSTITVNTPKQFNLGERVVLFIDDRAGTRTLMRKTDWECVEKGIPTSEELSQLEEKVSPEEEFNNDTWEEACHYEHNFFMED